MNIKIKSALLGAVALAAAPLVISPAFAQARAAATSSGAPIVPGLAVANIEAVVVNSNAFKTAAEQRKTTYKATYDAAEARGKQLNAQIQPMITKLQTDSQAATPNQAALQQQYARIQQELQRILQPVALSEAYVNEQINEKLEAAIQAAMNKQKVSVVLNPQSVVAAAAAYNLNQAILAELNTALPSAQLVPPAGWEPREVREAKAAQAQAQGAAAPGQPAGPQPTGR
jgi:Skp family chaperone for outer membrane proteins